MAGHSQFKNIMHRKGAQDAKRAKVFTKIIRELGTAARMNSDPDSNPRLRQAIIAARAANMPKDTMDRAIKRGAGGEDSARYEEVRYEGYGPGGVAIIVEALTDNRNRTASDVRAAFTKYGGSLGETNSVNFLFDRIGLIIYPQSTGSYEKFFEAVLEAGGQDVEETDNRYEVESSLEDFAVVRDHLITVFGDPLKATLTWRPQTTTLVDEEKATSLLKFIEVLEDNDDVQNVFSNFEMPEEVLEKLASEK